MKFLFEFLRGDELGSSLMTVGQRTRITVHIKLIGGETTRPAEIFLLCWSKFDWGKCTWDRTPFVAGRFYNCMIKCLEHWGEERRKANNWSLPGGDLDQVVGEDGEAWCTQTYSEGVWGESDSISKEAEDIESKWTVFYTPLPKQLQRAEAGDGRLSGQ